MRHSSASLPGVRVQGHILRASRADARVWGIALAGILLGVVLAPFSLRVYPGAVAVLSLGPLFLRIDRKTMPDMLFGPASFMYLYHALGYAVGPIGQIFVSGFLNVGATQFEEGLILAQWGAVLGLLVFAAAYPRVFRLVSSRFPPGRFPETNASERTWGGYGVAMLAVATAIITYGYVTGAGNRLAPVEDVSVGASTFYTAFQYAHQVMFFFFGFIAARRSKGWVALWFMVYATYSLIFILDGARGTVVTAGLLSAVGLVAGGTSARKVLGVVLVAGIAFIPLSGVVHKYRNTFLRPESLSERYSEFLHNTRDFSLETSVGEYGAADIFFERVTTFSVDRVFALTPHEIPFAGWEGIENIIFAFVPRIVLPDRPTLIDGNDLAIRYGAASFTTGSYMPAVGDGYRRFGWPGIVLVYAFSASLYAAVASMAYSLRARREWMAMLVFTMINASEIMIHSLLTLFYVLLWVMPKYLGFFYLLRWTQDGLSRIARMPHSARHE